MTNHVESLVPQQQRAGPLRSERRRADVRGEGVGLPSGEAVARRMGEPPLSGEEVGTSSAGWSSETPLWYYILREADVRQAGDRLGPVGSRIVGEVLVGLLDLDPEFGASCTGVVEAVSDAHRSAGWA
jgi:hypothetical protein